MQCRSGIGVCPDRGSHVSGTCIEDNFDITGSVSNGVTCVTYSRLLNTSMFKHPISEVSPSAVHMVLL